MKINRLVLASTSVFRKALLQQVGLVVEGLAPDTDEESLRLEDPKSLASARSEAKGLSLAFSTSDESFLAIAADQVLDFEGRAFGKADNADQAKQRLREFSGKRHYLHSAYTLVYYGPNGPKILISKVISAEMQMRALRDSEIEAYVATGEWKGCAGCYQYENQGMNLFETMKGDISTVIGLPLPDLLDDLRVLGVNPLENPRGPWTLSFG